MFLLQECIILSQSHGIQIKISTGINFMRFRTLNPDLCYKLI